MSNINPQWQQYQSINLEGGEGYNPYPKYLNESDEPLWSVLEGEASKMLRRCNNVQPWEGEAAQEAANAAYEAANAAYKAEFARARAAGEV